jgi:hypothetical protein
VKKDTFLGRNPNAVVEGYPVLIEPERKEEKTD